MIRIIDVDEAKRTILQRRRLGGGEIPPALRDGLRRIFGVDTTPYEAVRQIIKDVRDGTAIPADRKNLRADAGVQDAPARSGDAAVLYWTEKIDGLRLDSLVVPPEEYAAAFSRLNGELQKSLRRAADRIRAFHARQPLPSWSTNELGGELGQVVTPLNRVGVYVPGGSAPLPSSLLMSAIPAKVAGVKEVVVATPPGKSDGRVPDVVLAAAHLACVDAVYRMGGAQAIAALAFGTESIPKVDKIVGAGNLFVTLAKQQVYGQVGLDGLAGPTETVIVADDTANSVWLAADVLAQAEHDFLATAILLTPSRTLAAAVQAEVDRQLPSLPRRSVIEVAIAAQSGIIITSDIAQAVQLADEFAPEHLCLSVSNPRQWASRITHAGGLFIGERSFEVLGDYVAGPSHVMPTGGTARFASPLNVLDFVRITNVIALDERTAGTLSVHAARIARAEALDAHAQAAACRAADDDARADAGNTSNETPGLRCQSVFHEVEPYVPIVPFEIWAERLGRSPETIVKLDANENPYGPAPRARAALQSAKWLNIYPDPGSTLLRRALADYLNLPIEMIMAGSGVDELLDLLLRPVLAPGDVVVNCEPTFGMYAFLTNVNHGRLLDVKRRADFRLEVEAIAEAVKTEPRAKVLFVCSPNNPDGSVVSDSELQRLLELPLLVVLDEAYVEFYGKSRIEWIRDHSNMVVLRTFSKWAGLAGLRVGYGAFPDWLISRMWCIKQPYNVNSAGQQAALASLEEADWLMANVERLRAERGRLLEALRTLEGLLVYPSESNFILCRVVGRDALGLKRSLEQEGVLVRHFDRPDLRDCIRISVGRPQDSDALLRALRKLGV
jgi:histidinol dehydrogenase